jgi:hypothetical protein
MVNYNQACQRSDGSIYGLEDGKQCLKGTPVTIDEVRRQAKDLLSNSIKQARSRGASFEAIKKATAGSPSVQEAVSNLEKIKPRFSNPTALVNLARTNHKEEIGRIEKSLQSLQGKTLVDLAATIYYAKFDKASSSKGGEEKQIREALVGIRAIREAEGQMKLLRQRLIEKGSLKEAENMTTGVLENSNLKQLPRPTKEYAKVLLDLNRISNSQVRDLEKLYYTDERAYSVKKGTKIEGEENDRDGRINVGYQGNRSELRKDLWHEFGHQLEDTIPEYREAAIQWLKSRSNGKIEKLNKLGYQYEEYGDDELAYIGNFFDAYVGKFYPDGATEVISMGLESFNNPRTMVNLYQRDPEHFFLILGILDQI